MTKLYACLGSGNCMKPWLALNQLGKDFELALVDVLKGEQKSPEYLAVNPLGVVPCLITDTDQSIGESNAMLWHIAHGTDLMPASKDAQAEALQWMFFEQSKLEPFISPARFFNFILPNERQNKATDIAAWQDNAKPGLAHLNTHLQARKFMLTEGYSITDIALFGYVHVLDEAGLSFDDYPNIARWVGDVESTDGFKPLSALGASRKIAA